MAGLSVFDHFCEPDNSDMIKIGIVGATGYTGAELMRILAEHPQAELCVVTSRADAGKPVAELYPSLRGRVNIAYTDPQDGALNDCELVFFATPHGTSMHQVPALLEAGCRIIDLSADYRIRDAAVWETAYAEPHASPALLAEAVYGLPEWQPGALQDARLVACAGCYPTAVQLGLLPLLKAGVVDPQSLIADAKSGVSGAGRAAKIGSLFCETADSMHAYGVAGHRHLPEIEQGLSVFSGKAAVLTFVPHLAPMNRGIHATLYAQLSDPSADLQALFEACYANAPFVDVMPTGSHPATRSVRASNTCRLAVHRPGNGNTVVVLSVIDNLVKGASGQAVQCMNLMYGLDETTGLSLTGVLP